MIVPTIGRVVLCYNLDVWQGPLAGFINRIREPDTAEGGEFSDYRVNVQGFTDPELSIGGTATFSMERVPLLDPDVTPNPDLREYCTWMPFQAAQAKKTEVTPELVQQMIADALDSAPFRKALNKAMTGH